MFKNRKAAAIAAERLMREQQRAEITTRKDKLLAEAAGLPAFSSGCVKCGSHDVRQVYKPLYPSVVPSDYIVYPHMFHMCSCNYKWYTQTLDFG